MTVILHRRSRRALTRPAVLLAVACASLAQAADTPAPEPAAAEGQARPAARFEQFFAPWHTETAALSPDGRLLAYSLREADRVSVVIVEVDQPAAARAKVAVISDAQATPAMTRGGRERVPARINWMQWITPTRLTLETNRIFATVADTTATAEWASISGEVLAFDADGRNHRLLADAKRMSRQRPAQLPVSSGLIDTTNIPTGGAGEAGASGEIDNPGVSYRPPRVLGIDPASPDSLLVLGYSPPQIGRYSIHAVTGKMRYLDEEVLDPRMTMLLDRSGKPRIGIGYSPSKKFPLPFLLDTGKFGRPWRPLDEIAAAEKLPDFAMDPDTYFGERSVPLGFDGSGRTLYFASNGGRDHFGIYALDLETGHRAPTAIENPAIDLWEPTPGTFPDLRTSWYSDDTNLDLLVDAANAAYQASLGPTGGVTDAPPPDDSLVPPALETQRRSRVSTSIAPARNTDDRILVFDRFTNKVVGVRLRGLRPTTQWFREELNAAQALLETRFQPNTIEIREWDAAMERLLVFISGPAQAGTFVLFDRSARSAVEFAQRAPWLQPLTSTQMFGIGFESPQGVPIVGMITVPPSPRVRPIPVVVLTPRLPWQAFDPVYRAEVHALADMGFAVVEYSGRGAWGRGRALRERLREGYEDAQVEDLLATVDYVAKHFAISPKRIAVAGIDHGGHVALRALELAPERFRCAVAINAPVNLRTWLGELEWTGALHAAQLVSPAFGDIERQRAAPLVRDLARIARPALLFNFRGPAGSNATNNYTAAKQFSLAVNRRVPATEIVDLTEDYMNGLPRARAAVFARIEEFLNANVYDYTVKAGELEVDEPKTPEAPAP